jgi:membrane associated rhomboid family serine protease
MSQPDLFVVCKNCGSEVSPYVTECPYCGQRVRKRAPKLDRGEEPAPKPRRRVGLPRLRAGEIEGIAPDTRPYATFGLILISLAATLVWAAASIDLEEMGVLVSGPFEDTWRYVTTPFVHTSNLGYQFVALVAVALFGSMIERRFGAFPMVVIFLAGGIAGSALAVATSAPVPFEDNLVVASTDPVAIGVPVMGANGAALALLFAWLVDDRRAFRRGEDRENDLLGVVVLAAVLFLLSLAEPDANIAAAAGGAAAGAVLGLILPLFTRR